MCFYNTHQCTSRTITRGFIKRTISISINGLEIHCSINSTNSAVTYAKYQIDQIVSVTVSIRLYINFNSDIYAPSCAPMRPVQFGITFTINSTTFEHSVHVHWSVPAELVHAFSPRNIDL